MIVDINTPDFSVVHFPRSGGKYFTLNYCSMSNVEGIHTHDMSKLENKNVLSIVRDPVDCIASTVIVAISSNPLIDPARLVDEWIEEYLEVYSAILDSSSILVRFNHVINRFEVIAKQLSSIFGHTILNNFRNVAAESIANYLPSSKPNPNYDDVRQLVSANPRIELCYEIYNEALSKCMRI